MPERPLTTRGLNEAAEKIRFPPPGTLKSVLYQYTLYFPELQAFFLENADEKAENRLHICR